MNEDVEKLSYKKMHDHIWLASVSRMVHQDNSYKRNAIAIVNPTMKMYTGRV